MEGDRSLLRFLQKSKVDSDGIAFVETVFKASSPGSRWALDPVRKARQRVDDIYSEVVKEERVGALPLESLARRCIVQRHLNDLNVKFLKRVPWELGKRIWEDIINSGQDNFQVFRCFCEAYALEPDFLPAPYEEVNEGYDPNDPCYDVDILKEWKYGRHWKKIPINGNKTIYNILLGYSPQFPKFTNYSETFWSPPPVYGIGAICLPDKSIRFREHIIHPKYHNNSCSFPPWDMITPIISSPNLSWLVVLELSHSFSNANGWDLEDLKSISNIPNLGVLSIHGPSFQHPGSQIINDGFLSFWARGARHGGKLKHLRILIIHDDHILSSSYHAKNTAKSMFNDFDSFPSLSVVSLTTGLLYKGFYFIHRELPSLKQDVIQTLSCLGESLGWLNTQRIDKFIPMRPDVRHLLRPWCTRDLAKAYTILNEFEKGSRLAISSPHQSPTASLLALGLGVLADEIFPPLPAGSLPPIMVDLHFKKEQVFSPRDREAHLYAARNVKPWDESYVGFTDERVVFEKHRGRERVPETFLQGETVARGSQKAKRPNKNPTAREHRENGGNAITTKSKSSSSSSLALRNTKKRGIEDTLNDIMFANTRKR